MRSIDQTMSDHFSDRETVISQQLNSGDSIVYINSVNNFAIGHFSRLGIYPFEDYPEYTYTRNFVTFDSIDMGNNSLSLSSPYSGNTLPVGTKVAQLKASYGTYMYSTAEGSLVPNQWTCYSGEIYGQQNPMTTHKQWRYGSAFIKIILLLN